VQRAIVLIGNAHFFFINDHRKAIMATSMPENMDMLPEKEGLNVLSKSKEDLFGKTILKLLAKTSKNNKELQDLYGTGSCFVVSFSGNPVQYSSLAVLI
jgi:hypothetical protein